MTRFEITYSASGIPLTKTVVEAIDIPAAQNIHKSMYGGLPGYILQFISVLSNGH